MLVAASVAAVEQRPGERRRIVAGDGAALVFRPELGFRPDVEGLRALAVAAVVVYHAWPQWLPGGFVGVDVFFVVSGFLITSLLLREFESTGTISLRRFWARRARRLLPAATVTLVATAVAGRLLLDGLSTGVLARDLAAAAGMVANIRFGMIGDDYLTSSLPPSPVLHFWSLAVEEQFYLVWPSLVLVTLRVGRSGDGGRRLLGAVVVALGLGSLAWSVAWTSSEGVWAFFLLPTRAWELLAGAAVALGVRRGVHRGVHRGVATDLGRVGRVASSGRDALDADIVVNTTPVGMGGSGSAAVDPLPIEPGFLRAGHVVADIVYHPRRTALLEAASAVGAATVEGLGMLVHQAAIQQQLWHGDRPDTAVMRAAADRELAARGR